MCSEHDITLQLYIYTDCELTDVSKLLCRIDSLNLESQYDYFSQIENTPIMVAPVGPITKAVQDEGDLGHCASSRASLKRQTDEKLEEAAKKTKEV